MVDGVGKGCSKCRISRSMVCAVIARGDDLKRRRSWRKGVSGLVCASAARPGSGGALSFAPSASPPRQRLPAMSAPIRRALVSVSDKAGLADLGRFLAARGVEVLSTGGSAKALADAGVPVIEVSEYTGFPEIMDGRVKTLQPRIHGGLLAVRGDARPRTRDGGARHPADRSADRQPLSVRGDGGEGRSVRRVHREYRHRRPGADPRRGEEPRLRHGDRRSRRLSGAAGGDDGG